MKTLWKQLWLFWLFVSWGCCFVASATVEINDVNQTAPTFATHTSTTSGAKRTTENNLALQQPKKQQGSIYKDIIRHLICTYIEGILLFPSVLWKYLHSVESGRVSWCVKIFAASISFADSSF